MKTILLIGVDVTIDDAEITLAIEQDTVTVTKDVEGSADVYITKGLLGQLDDKRLASLASCCLLIVAERGE